MGWLDSLATYPFILFAVVIVSWLFPLPAAYHPLAVFRFFAQQLAKKVHPNIARSKQQQLISGSLAIVVALVPCLGVLYALYLFSELPFILDALLLYCSLDWRTQSQTAQQVQGLLQRQQLSLARQQANYLLLRDTQTLNAMGLSKAIIESLLLQSSKLFIATLGYFLIGGGFAALAYRLLQELARQWNPKLNQFRFFGAPANFLATLLAGPALLVASLIIAIQSGVLSCYRQCKQSRTFFHHGSFYLLSCASVALKCDLGGPAIYGSSKVPRMRFGANSPPTIADISKALWLVRFLHLYLLLLVIAAVLVQYLWHYLG